MKDSNLISTGFQTADLESAHGIGEHGCPCTFDHHIGAAQISAVETVQHQTSDLGGSGLRRCDSYSVLLCGSRLRRLLLGSILSLGIFASGDRLALLSVERIRQRRDEKKCE